MSINRLQRTHSRVTTLAEGRKRRATRRAAEPGRYANQAELRHGYDILTCVT